MYAYVSKLLKLTVLFKFSNQNFKCNSHGTCCDHVICLDLNPLIIFGEEIGYRIGVVT
jgi:hypothetical protein